MNDFGKVSEKIREKVEDYYKSRIMFKMEIEKKKALRQFSKRKDTNFIQLTFEKE
jgi:predicted solute-binding protein